MPFMKPEIWEKHLFQNLETPNDIIIPVDDSTVWNYYPELRWIMNKLNLCEIQGLKYGPHGTYPDFWPVFSKPLMNIWGMGIGSDIIKNKKELDNKYHPGHFWMEYLTGDHLSIDIVIVNGKPKWWAHSIGRGNYRGTFDFWEIKKSKSIQLKKLFDISFLKHFSSYTGVLNIEVIDKKIIECHPRLCPQFVPIYGDRWLKSIISLYSKKKWINVKTSEGYSIPLFLNKSGNIPCIDYSIVNQIKNKDEIFDVQICIDEEGDLNGLANPPGGDRIALISSKSLSDGCRARDLMKLSFLSASS